MELSLLVSRRMGLWAMCGGSTMEQWNHCGPDDDGEIGGMEDESGALDRGR